MDATESQDILATEFSFLSPLGKCNPQLPSLPLLPGKLATVGVLLPNHLHSCSIDELSLAVRPPCGLMEKHMLQVVSSHYRAAGVSQSVPDGGWRMLPAMDIETA